MCVCMFILLNKGVDGKCSERKMEGEEEGEDNDDHGTPTQAVLNDLMILSHFYTRGNTPQREREELIFGNSLFLIDWVFLYAHTQRRRG